MVDKNFTNRLESNINNWLKDIRKVTQLEHLTQTGTTIQELNFWAQMEESLSLLKEQLASEEVQMVFAILKQSNKFRIVMQFNADTDIDPKLRVAKENNKGLKEIPIKAMLESETVEQIGPAIKKIFTALKRMRIQTGTQNYPLERLIELGQCVG